MLFRRARRRIALAASLGALVLSVALYLFSCLCFVRTADLINGRSRFDVGLFHGGMQVEYYETPISWIAVSRGVKWSPAAPRMWFNWSTNLPRRTGSTSMMVFVPMWLPVVLSGGLTLLAWRAHRAPQHGRCPQCGYSLAGIDTDVCPECGGATAPRSRAAPSSAEA